MTTIEARTACPHCGRPAPGLLAGRREPDCVTKSLDEEMVPRAAGGLVMMTDEQIDRAASRLTAWHYKGRVAALADVIAEIERFRKGGVFGPDPLDLLKSRVTRMLGAANAAAEAVSQ